MLFPVSVKQRNEKRGIHGIVLGRRHHFNFFEVGIQQKSCLKACNLAFYACQAQNLTQLLGLMPGAILESPKPSNSRPVPAM